MRQAIVPSFADSLARGDRAKAARPDIVTGLLIVAVTVLAIQVALGLVFDPRYRDFTYAPLTAAIVPVAVLALFSRWSKAGLAETIAACVLLLSAIYIVFNEGFANWQIALVLRVAGGAGAQSSSAPIGAGRAKLTTSKARARPARPAL